MDKRDLVSNIDPSMSVPITETRHLDGGDGISKPRTIDVVDGGVQTTVQAFPGRLGYRPVGVPPSGPMDDLAFRLANRIVGNAESAAALECTACGPTLRFGVPATIALAGAAMEATVDGVPVEHWVPVDVAAGTTLRLGAVSGDGCRTYVAVRGGLDVPDDLGSRSTFTLGGFGGYDGRALRAGDVLRIGIADEAREPRALPCELAPQYSSHWEIGVVYGPHGAPEFFTAGDIETFFSTDWAVHDDSSRTGVRLIGPKPGWARPDGGEAGLHPSNIHDNAYAVGSIGFAGDMPIILGPDGPTLGGFVCPATVIAAELWKIGQLKPGDQVRFVPVNAAEADRLAIARDQEIDALSLVLPRSRSSHVVGPLDEAVLHWIPQRAGQPEVTYRSCGDRALLIEYGPAVLDLELRFRAHALMTWLETNPLPGVIDLTPGIRSLQVHFDNRALARSRLERVLREAEASLPAIDEMEVPTRVVHLPLTWDDPTVRLAVEKYAQGVRRDAPWCPSNVEFIRRINGLATIEEVREIVFAASYLVLVLGAPYLGVPLATPLDPRHRLVTIKQNPAPTWTPENAVGIGGTYLRVHGMEGPGGDQLLGRTVPIWNHRRTTKDLVTDKPWLLRFFDQIRFFPVSAEDLRSRRVELTAGRARLEIREETFRLRDYQRFLADHRESIAAFKARQRAAFEAERARSATADLDVVTPLDEATPHDLSPLDVPSGCQAVLAHVPGNVWKVEARPGRRVAAGDVLVVIESMNMEIPILAPVESRVVEVRCAEGRTVSSGDALCILSSGGGV